MTPLQLFLLQFFAMLAGWATVVMCLVRPHVSRLDARTQLMLWTAPECFRGLGLGLLVPALSPGMPREFAIATAIGDGTTTALAVATLWLLRSEWKHARRVAWACHLVGLLDICLAFPHAAHSGAIDHLATQWYVPVLAGPLMVICHVLAIATLRSQTPRRVSIAR